MYRQIINLINVSRKMENKGKFKCTKKDNNCGQDVV